MGEHPVLIQMTGVSYRYPGSEKNVLDALNFTFSQGQRIGLIAPNGSGKTTLFHLIMGLIRPDAGEIVIFGNKVQREKDFLPVRRRIGMLFQDSDDQLFSPTVIEDVAFGPLNQGKSVDDALAISRKTLHFLGLDAFEDRVTFKLSGGEKRLVALATILSMEPDLLLLDEPTTGLDSKTKATLIEVLNRLALPSIVISHEFDFITSVTDHAYTIENGKINMDEELHIHEHHHVHKHGKKPHKHV